MKSLFKRLRSRKMRIVCYGHPALRKISEPISDIDEDVRILADKMTYTLTHNDIEGVGLAAPQVGVNRRMIVIDTCGDNPDMSKASPGEVLLNPMMPVTLINPELVAMSPETCSHDEGCLSIPGAGGTVTRSARVTLKATLLNGQTVQAECANLLAICLQHEIDHLDGIVFTDRISAEQQKEVSSVLEQLAKEEAVRARR